MINNKINAIKDKICTTVMPKRIYLFGSFAKDTYKEDRDYDFYVIVPDDAGNRIELSQKAYKSLRGIRKRPVDIMVGYESSFDEQVKKYTEMLCLLYLQIHFSYFFCQMKLLLDFIQNNTVCNL